MPAVDLPNNFEDHKMESLRKRVKDHHIAMGLQTKEKFQEVLSELYFLQSGGNMMDFLSWKRKPPTAYFEFVKTQPLELQIPAAEDAPLFIPPNTTESPGQKNPVSTVATKTSTPVKLPTNVPSKNAVSASLPTLLRAATTPQVGRPPTTVMTPEQIVEKAKQEAHVVQRIAELQREGLWSEKRLPKVAEPPRAKSHWDYLLEEMVWLAADFAQERKWKKNSARKCGRMVLKHFQDKAAAAAKAEKEEEQRLRKIASFVAKEIRTFWSNVEKLVEYKQQIRLEEKRKRVLDQHLNFIVNETEKYSSLLTEGLKQPQERITEVKAERQRESDGEFEPDDTTSTDDEETIAQEETLDSVDAAKNNDREKEEIDALKRESEIPLEDILDNLPPEYLESLGKREVDADGIEEEKMSDDEYELNSDESEEDDEETIDQAEKEELESRADELLELEAEKDMPIEKLLAKYSGNPNPNLVDNEDMEEEEEERGEDVGDSEGLSGASESEVEFEDDSKDNMEVDHNVKESLGIESLLDDSLGGQDVATSKLSDAAALAESFQPKGNTLESTKVIAKVPFLLKYPLREYQHIGLDWMAAMYERKLNGILADEMGLGKTIQTIGLLAWLACEKGIWGPHLVVVPTSVMLNWEMEFKKWCPSFKILTYYGSQKDRRQKRMGWTKPNAFHVCITSYKLVIQDHQAFRRKRWRYFILDEAQNIKNFKSQRWQLLLNFQSQRRLLLTGTPLQNNLMELWSLMHFLMPDIFGSHRDFREWFSNPVSGMIEGNAEYNESIIRRLHKVLRPFILRRLKSEVEKQMPQKYEHVVMCRLSKRQRYLYDDFMSKAKTKETLSTGNLLSVINVLMQLRKVCNHPNLFEPRPIVSPFQMDSIVYHTASPVYGLLDYNPFEHINLHTLNLMLLDLEFTMTAYTAHRIRKFQVPAKLIEEIDRAPPLPPLCPRGKLRLHVTTNRQPQAQQGQGAGRGVSVTRPSPAVGVVSRPGTNSVLGNAGGVASPQQPRLGAPAPLLSSSAAAAATSGALTRPPVQVQPTGAMNAISASSASTVASSSDVPVKDSVNEKIAGSGDGRLNLSSAVAQQILNVAANQNDTASNAGLRSNLRNLIAVSSSSSAMGIKPSTPPPVSAISSQQRASQNGPEHPNGSKRSSKWSYDRSLFKNNPVDEKKRQERRDRLIFLAKLNKIKCEASPIWGSDVIIAVTTTSQTRSSEIHESDREVPQEELPWSRRGECYLHCLKATEPLVGRRNYESLWSETNAIRQMLHTPEQYIDELSDILQRFVVYTPAVTAPPIVFHASHPPPSKLWSQQKRDYDLKSNLSPLTAILHPIQSAMMTQFPDPRLIQYDCGKLQTLDNLLRHLKTGKHRVLIFTQMTRMLDVLEAFLNHHGHIYLRLDGTTRVDQRQVLMERFNADRRIFCFILSTRSGGVGVNLTGADTVIFYDSDWNPTMDAQAQDRCHRIGQTRDVHIYRLISERTVEENILKKANQKRLLGDIAIEGGNFTAATFKKQTIHDLFEVDVNEADASKRMAEVLDRPKTESSDATASSVNSASNVSEGVGQVAPNKAALGILESALAAAEDETDVAAARIVRAEAAAEMAEFDESAPLGAGEDGENNIVDAEINKAEVELQQLEEQLTPVERYALKYMESSEECWSAEQLRAAEAQIEEQKRAWELKRLATLTGNDDERGVLNDSNGGITLEPDDGLLTYSHQDSVNQRWISMDGLEEMPIWCPPTPPQDDSDVYMDYTLSHLYDTRIMDEASLPPVYVRKELKRPRKESVQAPPDDGRRPAKVRKEETVYAPRSLFDRPSPALAKLRRDLKLQKCRGIVRPPIPLPNLTLKTPALPIRPIEENENTPEWLIHEDWILLQAVQNLLELPLNLVVLTPAHTPNWDLVADMVNSYSRSYRSPKQCRNRYFHVILPREEGKAAIDSSPKKIKKTKSLQPPIPTKTGNRQMRTSQLFAADGNNSFTTVWHQKFETLKSIFHKKAPTNRSMLTGSGASANRNATNAKHAQVLQEAGISYDTPLNPVQVAAVRAERIAQKQKAAVAMAEQVQVQQQQQRLANLSTASPTVSGAPGTPSSPATTARVTSTAPPSTLAANPMASAATVSSQLGSTVVVNTIPSTSSSNTQHTLLLQGSGGTNIHGSPVQQQVVLQSATGIRTQRPLGTLTVQEVVTGASPVRSQQQAGTLMSGSSAAGQTVVTVGNLTAVQVQAATQMLASAGIAVSGAGVLNTVTTTAAGINKGASVTLVQTGGTTVVSPATGATKTLTPTQLQYLRQQALAKQQQQRLQEQQLKKLQLVTAGGAAGATQQLTATGVTTTGQKLPLVGTVATSLAGTATSLSSLNTVQIAGQTQTGARTQLLKGNATAAALLGKGGTVARAIVTDSEMAALIKRQQQFQQQQKAVAAANAGSSNLQANLTQQQTVQIGAGSNTTGITTAQFLAQAGLQVQTAPAAGGQPQVATLVKTVSTPGSMGGAPSVTIPVSAISVGLPQVQMKGLTAAGVKAGTTSQQQLRQLTIQHQLLQQRKTQQQQQAKTGHLAQTVTLGTVKGVPGQQLATAVGTVQLVQPVGGNATAGGTTVGGATAVSKPGAMSTTVTMQQLQQVIRQVTAGNAQVLVSSPSSGSGVSGTGLLTKNQQGQTVQARVIPVSQQGLKQTIQVVTTGQPGSAGGTTRVATLNATAAGGTMAPSLASALAAGTWKVAGGTDAQQKALLSQVSAALQSGQPVSLAVRAGPNSSGGQTRILTTGTTFTTVTVTSVAAAPITATTPAPTVTTPSTATATVVPQPTVVATAPGTATVAGTASGVVPDVETLASANPNNS
ncbi:hypothetical protein GHT06_008551 [Daphnia sinensis]|uniref:Helicase domino n=1 Tax=Daphnia sinensis TaxID=1820382 RepID=A0AAD5Q2V1_9CRUS|nr:hypothetical protein GHT06_008551 [Daphnia sinensis]